MRSPGRLLLVCALTFLCALAEGADAIDVEGSKDHPLLSRFPGAVITQYNQKVFDEFEIPIPVDGNKPVKTQHVEGKVTRIRYWMPEGRSIAEVFRSYDQALQKAGFQTLYRCVPPKCGDPGDDSATAREFGGGWNYGDHHHAAAKLARPEGDVFAAIDVDAQQYYVYIVEIKPMHGGQVTVDAAPLANDIGRVGHASVYGIYFDTGKADVKPESNAALKQIAAMLQKNTQLKVYVVGHTDNQGALDENMGLSTRRAKAVVQALSSKYGVPSQRLAPIGVGPAAPVASNDSDEGRAKNRRVELVKQ